jgi:hypothetical protein
MTRDDEPASGWIMPEQADRFLFDFSTVPRASEDMRPFRPGAPGRAGSRQVMIAFPDLIV